MAAASKIRRAAQLTATVGTVTGEPAAQDLPDAASRAVAAAQSAALRAQIPLVQAAIHQAALDSAIEAERVVLHREAVNIGRWRAANYRQSAQAEHQLDLSEIPAVVAETRAQATARAAAAARKGVG